MSVEILDPCGVSGLASGRDWLVHEEAPQRRSWVRRREIFEKWPLESELEPVGRSCHLELEHISQAIYASRKILNLKEDWDDEGSAGYEETTWKRATDFLLNHARWLWKAQGILIDAPRILPGPDGSIDLHWKARNFE